MDGDKLHAQEQDLGRPHQQAVEQHSWGLWIRSARTGVVTTWVWHAHADQWEGTRRIVYVYGPSLESVRANPRLAGWRVFVHV